MLRSDTTTIVNTQADNPSTMMNGKMKNLITFIEYGRVEIDIAVFSSLSGQYIGTTAVEPFIIDSEVYTCISESCW